MATFSSRLQKLLSSKEPKTLQTLVNVFAVKSFAILILLLLAIPALPLPTGGVTHLFEIIAALISLELISGRKKVWLPKMWLAKPLPQSLQSSALPKFIKIISWFEKFSRPRLRAIQTNWLYIRLVSIIILLFTIFAFIAPPFSGLDTLPALGVVILALGLILEDALLSIIGFIVGCVGVGLIFIIGSFVFRLF